MELQDWMGLIQRQHLTASPTPPWSCSLPWCPDPSLSSVFQFHALSSPQSPFTPTPTSRRALHRTLSDESIYSGQREHFFASRASLLDQALPNDVLFSSTYPSLPKSLPLRRPSYTLGMKSLHGKCACSCSWAVRWVTHDPAWQAAVRFLGV